MWLYTNIGFFSIVEKPEDQDFSAVTVRARVKADLQALKMLYMPSMGTIIETPHSDYRYRAKVSKSVLQQAMAALVQNINYNNFKDEVSAVQGHDRASFYSDVWNSTYNMGKLASAAGTDPHHVLNQIALPFAKHHCAMVFDRQKRVLMRTHYWTELRTVFLHMRQRCLESPQIDFLYRLYHVTGHEAKVALTCSITVDEAFPHWNYYVMPIDEDARSEYLSSNYSWVPLERVTKHIARIEDDETRTRDFNFFQAAQSYCQLHEHITSPEG